MSRKPFNLADIIGGSITGGIAATLGAVLVGGIAAMCAGPIAVLAPIGAAVFGFLGAGLSHLNAETNEKGHDGATRFYAGLAAVAVATGVSHFEGTRFQKELEKTRAVEASLSPQFTYVCTGKPKIVENKAEETYTVTLMSNAAAPCRAVKR